MSLTSKIQALLTYANETTGAEDTTLGDAVKSLADGYGQGGGDENLSHFIKRDSCSLSIAEGLTVVGKYAFYYWDTLQSIVLPNSVTSIGIQAFQNCLSLTSVELGTGLKTINSYAFMSCTKLASIVIPEGVNTLPVQCFMGCSSMQTAILPSSLTTILGNCFNGAKKLETITCRATTPPTLNSTAFTNCTALANIYVPADSVNEYKAASVWSNYADIISAIEE